jgi:hypothetical protein
MDSDIEASIRAIRDDVGLLRQFGAGGDSPAG